MYNKPFLITENTGNNAFSFHERENPAIYVPELITGSLDDVAVGDQIAFEEIDDDGILHSCIGLKHFVTFPHPDSQVPIVVVDCHNHVFFFWYQAWLQGQLPRGCQLVHIDAHRDTRIPEMPLSPDKAQDLQAIFTYTNTVLNVGNYIPPAIEEGLIGELASATGERELRDIRPQPPFILNLDLDFWAQGEEFVDKAATMAIIRPWLPKAALITIATSPYFIDQHHAIGLLRELLGVD